MSKCAGFLKSDRLPSKEFKKTVRKIVKAKDSTVRLRALPDIFRQQLNGLKDSEFESIANLLAKTLSGLEALDFVQQLRGMGNGGAILAAELEARC